jgi:hypothetical protein
MSDDGPHHPHHPHDPQRDGAADGAPPQPDDGAYKVGPGKPPRQNQWKKGQSGNPKGRPKGTGLTDAVRRVLAQEHHGRPVVDVLAEVMLKHALAGKFPFAKEIWDRVEGKTQDKVEVKSDGPTVITILPPKVIGRRDREDEMDARPAQGDRQQPPARLADIPELRPDSVLPE